MPGVATHGIREKQKNQRSVQSANHLIGINKGNMNNKLEKEFQIEMVPEVTQRIVALSGKINQILAVKTSEITGLEDFITSLLASERADWLRSEIEKLEGSVKTGNNGEGLPFENSPEIYGNARMEAWKNGHNTALTSIITRYKEELDNLTKE